MTERNTPVLTAELDEGLPRTYRPFESLQDIIGSLVKLDLPVKAEKAEKAEKAAGDSDKSPKTAETKH